MKKKSSLNYSMCELKTLIGFSFFTRKNGDRRETEKCVKPQRERNAEMEIYSHVVWCGNTWKPATFRWKISLNRGGGRGGWIYFFTFLSLNEISARILKYQKLREFKFKNQLTSCVLKYSSSQFSKGFPQSSLTQAISMFCFCFNTDFPIYEFFLFSLSFLFTAMWLINAHGETSI